MGGNDRRQAGLSTSRRMFVKATGAATATAALGVDNVAALEASDHVETLLEDLSLEKKVGQMTQVAVGTVDPSSGELPDNFAVSSVGELFSELGVGSILSGGATPPSFDGQTVVRDVNALQEYNLDQAPHEIPFLWGIDAVHGNATLAGATSLPQRLNMGATRDPELIERAERHTSKALAAMGAHWTFAPTTDVHRDPRWGRFFEGVSEDPMLEGEVSSARVRGLESADRVCSTVKHFGAYSIPNNGNDRAAADTSMRDLRTNLLPAYRRALDDEPQTLMVNSGAVNGVPAHASEWLLTRMLRDHYGFEGLALSDWDDFNRLITNHDYVPDFEAAVRVGINAGVDMYMVGNTGNAPGPTEFIDTAVSLVEAGEIPEERIDNAVRRVLQLKEDLGLFDQPTADESRIGSLVGGAQDASETLAKESLVLLKNDDALPLSGDEDVLLTGPGVNPDPEGDLSWMATETGFLMQHGGWTLGWQGVQNGYPSPDGPRPRQNTIPDTLRAELGSDAVTYEPTGFYADPFNANTSDPNGDFTFEKEDAVRSAAADADAVVVVLGEGPHNEGFGDRDTLALDEAQRDIVAAVTDEAPQTPVVGVVLAGSPRGTAETFDKLDAVLFAGQPGSDTGRAVTDVLLGEYNPSGKLPFQWPAGVGQVPNHYNAYPPLDGHAPLYEFGHGLSYTSFEYSSLSVSPGSVADPADTQTVTVSVDVANTGDVAGDHVVEVYNTQSYGSVLQPNRRLLGFSRVSLDAGQSTTVEIEADLQALEVVPGPLPGAAAKTVEAGDYELTVGGQTTTLTVESAGSVSGLGPIPGGTGGGSTDDSTGETTETPTDSPAAGTTTAGGGGASGTDTTTTGGSGPGFGLLTGLAALGVGGWRLLGGDDEE